MSAPVLEKPLEHRALLQLEPQTRSDMVIESLEGLYRDQPEMSARKTTSKGQRVFFVVLALILLIGLLISWVVTLRVVASVLVFAYVAAVSYRLLCLRRALRDDSVIRVSDGEAHTEIADEDLPVFTVLAPCYREPEVVAQLLSNLAAMDYPTDKLDVVLLLEEGDVETTTAAIAADPEPWVRLVVVPRTELTTKPRALTYGLKIARGSIVTVYDAEDRPEPLQLRRAAVAFARDEKLSCIQARLEFHNADQNIITRWFTAEYVSWFLHFLPGLISLGAPLPLGGTSNHIRISALSEVGGWDPYNVTEDADLGLRLERRGHRIGVLDSVTMEEANSDFVNWNKQRSRWYKGYLQTSLVHLRHPLKLRRELGFSGIAGVLLFVLGTPVLALLQPVFWALTLVWFIVGPRAIEQVFSGPVFFAAWISWVIGNTSMVYLGLLSARQARRSDLLWSQLISPVYWVMMSLAAVKALIQIVKSPSFWEKTVHGLDEKTIDLSAAGTRVDRPAPNVTPYVVLEPEERAALQMKPVAPVERRLRRSATAGWFLTFTALYMTLGTILVMHYHAVPIDATSRTDNAFYTIFSRDPHLAAIGFVWNPLPSLLQIPVLLFSPLYHPLISYGLAGVIVSAPVMAAAVVQLRGIMVDRNCGVVATSVVALLFGLHPMIVYYGSNGMSEAYLILFTIMAVRYVSRWTVSQEPNHLVIAATALALGYLARYEAAIVGAGLVLLVTGTSFVRSKGRFGGRVLVAAHDTFLVGLPLVVTFAIWSGLSALIVGSPFEQFTSRYGNAEQIRTFGESDTLVAGSRGPLGYTAAQVTDLEPLALGVVLLAVIMAVVRRRPALLAPVVACIPCLLFAFYSFDHNLTFGWLRFSILVVVLVPLLIALMMPTAPTQKSRWRSGAPKAMLRGVAVLAAAAVLVPAFFTSVHAMRDPSLGREEFGEYQIVVHPDEVLPPGVHRYDTERRIAAYLDSLNLPHGSVLTDVAHSFSVVSSSNDPKQFVITNDRDFEQILSDPAVFGVRYMLVIPGGGGGEDDALNIKYPSVYNDGAGISTLFASFPSDSGGNDYRLYAVTPLPAGEPTVLPKHYD